MSHNAAWLIVLIAVAGSSKGDERHPVSSAPESAGTAKKLVCEKHGAASILASSVNRSRALGSMGAPARAIDDEVWFATDCPFKILDVYGHAPEKDCRPEDSPANLPIGLKMKIVRVGSSDTFVMTLGTIEADLHPVRFVAPGQLDTNPPFDFLVGDDKKHRKYFVYFRDSLGPHVGVHQKALKKSYGIQMFYPDPANPGSYLCADHMPDHDSGDAKLGTPSPAMLPVQGGVGGGTEPPHHY